MKFLALFPNWVPLLAAFPTGKDVGDFLNKVFAYIQTGQHPTDLSDMGNLAFAVMKPFIDSSKERYTRKREIMRMNGRKGGMAKSMNNRLRMEAGLADFSENHV